MKPAVFDLFLALTLAGYTALVYLLVAVRQIASYIATHVHHAWLVSQKVPLAVIILLSSQNFTWLIKSLAPLLTMKMKGDYTLLENFI